MYFFLRTIDFKINRLESNPAIPKLKRKLELFIQTLNEEGNNKNPLITSYINSVLALSLQEISSKYRNINSASMSSNLNLLGKVRKQSVIQLYLSLVVISNYRIIGVLFVIIKIYQVYINLVTVKIHM